MDIKDCFNLGYISKSVGTKGELILTLDVDDTKRYRKMESVFVEINKVLVPFFITKMEMRPNTAMVSFDGVNTPQRADELKGCRLYLPLQQLPPLKGKKFYFHEIVGYTVSDEHKGDIGVVEKILEFPQQAIFQIKKDSFEILIPVKDEFIVRLDREKRHIELNAPVGLIDLYLNPAGNDSEEE